MGQPVLVIDNIHVGVDIEQIEAIDMDSKEIAQKTFSEIEYKALQKIPVAERGTRFFLNYGH